MHHLYLRELATPGLRVHSHEKKQHDEYEVKERTDLQQRKTSERAARDDPKRERDRVEQVRALQAASPAKVGQLNLSPKGHVERDRVQVESHSNGLEGNIAHASKHQVVEGVARFVVQLRVRAWAVLVYEAARRH